MSMFRVLAAAFVCTAAMLGAGWSGALAQDAPAGDAAKGKAVFLKEACFTCHGRVGQGGAYNGPAPVLAQTALPLEAFRAQIRNPVNDMPAYSDAVLSDQDIADIYAFVKSLSGPRSPKDIPILNN
jgi:mono/diheme cytochrome c family protein